MSTSHFLLFVPTQPNRLGIEFWKYKRILLCSAKLVYLNKQGRNKDRRWQTDVKVRRKKGTLLLLAALVARRKQNQINPGLGLRDQNRITWLLLATLLLRLLTAQGGEMDSSPLLVPLAHSQ